MPKKIKKAKKKIFEKIRIGWTADPDNDLLPSVLRRLSANSSIKREDVDNDVDLVRIPHAHLARHMAIVAQSGSGKSFFLGRLLEELAVHAKARCLIFDPNGDFVDLHTIVSDKTDENYPWQFDSKAKRLTHDELDTFEQQWKETVLLVKSQTEDGATVATYVDGKKSEQLVQIRWPKLKSDLVGALLGAGLDGFAQRQVLYCHEFVKRISEESGKHDFVSFAEDVLDVPAMERNTYLAASGVKNAHLLTDLARHIEEDGHRVYFGALAYFRKSKLFAMTKSECAESAKAGESLRKLVQNSSMLDVIDLPSASSNLIKELMVGAFLQLEWDAAINAAKPWKTPRFIVVDEAHNLIPADPPTESLGIIRDQFVRVAAEGRKYGLFLIVMTQRPDKVDPRVLSECDNRLVMKLGSRAVLDSAKKLLGLDLVPNDVLAQCTQFGVGRGLMVGKWSVGKKGYNFVYGGARRTSGAAEPDHDSWGVEVS